MNNNRKIRVAVLGTGKIASDLAARIHAAPDMTLAAVAGRRPESEGLERIAEIADFSTPQGLSGLRDVRDEIDGVFDATSAFDHLTHWSTLQEWGKWVIDLTPSRVGKPTVPVLGEHFPRFGIEPTRTCNYSMVTCGGQSGSPIAAAFARNAEGITAVEVSSSIASDSAGPATRRNIDDYVVTTEGLLAEISGTKHAKAILVLNPAEPPPLMRTTVTMKARVINSAGLLSDLDNYVATVRNYVPGYSIVVPPHQPQDGVVSATAVVEGEGYFLPKHAGNLDIINAASIEVARRHFAENWPKS